MFALAKVGYLAAKAQYSLSALNSPHRFGIADKVLPHAIRNSSHSSVD
jgi:hypothetical protein